MAASSVYSNEEAAQQPDELYYSTARAATLLVLLLLAAHAAAYAKLRLSVGADRDTDDVVPMLLGTLALGYSWSHAALILLAFAAVSHAPAILCSVLLQRAADACRYLLVPFAYLYHEAVGVGYAWGPSRAIGRAAEASALMALIALLVKGTLDVLGLLLPAAAPNGMSAPRALQALFSAASVLLALLSATRGAMHPLLTWITEERPSPSSAATATGSGAGALAAAEASLLLQPIVEDGWAVRMLQQMRGVREERGLLGAARAAARATLHLAGGALWALLSMRVLSAQLRMLASGGAAGAQGGQGDLPGSWIGHCLAAYFVAAAVLGHHLLCRYQLTNMGTSRRPRGTPLQMQLLEVATLQALTPAIPGAAHALGLVANGLKKRTLVEGTLRVLFSRRRGFVELGAEPGGFVDKSLAVKTDDLAAAASAPDRNSVNLNGFAALNRALHGDRVAVCLDTDESAEGSGDRVAMGLDTDESAEGSGTDYAAKDDGSILGAIYQSWAGLLNRKAPPVQAVEPVLAESFAGRDGRVVAVLQRNPRKLVAAVEARPAHLDDASPLLVTPRDERFPKMRLAGADASYDDLLGKLVVVEIVDWVEDEEYAEARHVSTLGTAGDGAVEAQAILIEHDVRVEPFSTAVEACLPREDYTISDAEIAKRLDLRHGPALISSIDPPGCKDIDDAIHARALGDGKYEVGVHISDVCSFIEAGSALDREAAARAETFYLINARANMVPPLLSENLASLHPNVDRLAFSVIWHMDEEANISSTQFVKTVIRSKAALSYDEAQRRIDDESFDDELSQSLRVLMRITRARKEQRRLNDALELDSQEVAFRFDGDGSEASKAEDGVMQLPTGMRRLSDGEPSETHSLIEELMVLANVSVAEEIVRTFPSKSLLRHHPRPNLEQFDDIRAALERRNLPFDARDNAALSRTLRATRDPKEESFGSVVRALCTRRMKMAQYFRTGSMAPKKWMHSGLGEPLYTHFTSPIRRYCDQVVHRQLAHAIGWRALPAEGWYTDNLDDLSESLNERHKMAQEAERKSEALYLTLYFRDRKVVEDAYVTKLGDAGVGLMLPEYGIEGYTPLVSAGYENPWTLDSKKGELQAGSNLKLRVLDKVRVRVGTELGPALKPRLVLTIVHPPLPQGRKLPPSRLGRASETFEGFEWGWRRGHGGKEELLIGPDKRKRKLDKRVQSTKRKAKPARTSSAA